MINVLNFEYMFFCLRSQPNVGYQDWNSQNACQNSKQGRPNQTASLETV